MIRVKVVYYRVRNKRRLTVADTTTNQAGQGKHTIEHTLGFVRKGDVLRPSGTQVRDGAVHTRRRKAEVECQRVGQCLINQ